jgi:DNA-binding NarL/FixJ family response regulator
MNKPLRAYLVDDNAAASLRLARVLKETGRVEVVGSSTQPLLALAQIPEQDVDVLFLDSRCRSSMASSCWSVCR